MTTDLFQNVPNARTAAIQNASVAYGRYLGAINHRAPRATLDRYHDNYLTLAKTMQPCEVEAAQLLESLSRVKVASDDAKYLARELETLSLLLAVTAH